MRRRDDFPIGRIPKINIEEMKTVKNLVNQFILQFKINVKKS